jgi:solute carrier family 13 (sodium-dependent dicarboxylate transporter), member 2/3/5
MEITKKTIGLFLGPIAFLLLFFFFGPEGLSKEGIAVLAVTSWVAIWWITEAAQVEVTALLPIVLFPLSGGLDLVETCAAYGHKFIFLFIGGFILAIAIEKWNLHRRIALSIIHVVGTNPKSIILGFMVSTAFLSMWISNTATTVMMLPIGVAIIKQMGGSDNKTQFGKALMLAIAYAASIGGVATLIGTPPNIILAGVIQQTYGVELTFTKWFMVGFPLSIVMLAICWQYITRFAFSIEDSQITGGKSYIKEQLRSLGKIGFEEKLVLVVFISTALLWIFRSAFLKEFIPALDDTIIAILAALVLFVLPSKQKGTSLLDWEDAVKLPWGILMLFGGGIAIAVAFDGSGLAGWIATQLSSLDGIALFVLLLILVASVNFLTEITSNLATASVLLPVLAPLALAMDVHPYAVMVACTIAASCAFMLPVATPPNAIVFGSGYLKISDMMRAGVWLNLISIVLITLLVYFLLPLLWDIEINQFPEFLK